MATPSLWAAPALAEPTTGAATAAEPPPSAPLRLDAAILKAAIAGSESPVRRMAQTAGEMLDSPRVTARERLTTAVGAAALPDCLAPDAGGSLLSAPLIAVRALRGKCK